ncbi:DnaD domain-containing protein [Streptococcus pluranimalium]|uniref:DnaD domain-containing protein n=1 Tax=Streptococcus pluranimalium TaxID=82348 RepID=UPI0039FCBF71
MAQRRMFSKEITTSDKFVDMPQSTRLLYYDLGMEADDEGFIGNARMLSRAYGANIDDLKLLQAKGFIIIFESGVTVVKDWNVNNKIRKDRIKPTIYTDEKSMLSLDNTGVYQFDNQMTTKRQPNGNQMTTKCPPSIGKDSIGKDRLEEDRGVYPPPPKSNLNFGQFVRAEGLKANDNHIQRLLDYIGLDGMDMDLVKIAVVRTTEQGIVAPAYTFSILDNWKKKGFTTVDQANKEQEEFEQQKSKSPTPPKTNVPEWSNPDYKAPDLDSLKVEIPEDYVEDPDAF